MAILSPTIPLVIANLLIPVAILTFASGFFPYKPFLPGLATYEDLDIGPPPGAPFNKVIFMVVDALRSDFVFSTGSGFTFTQSLISDGSAMPFTAHATSPTITMPRIKAITTGSIPSFLDVILNFAESDTSSTLATQDTWLAQMQAKGTGKMVMYGDDTWLKLFPETFDRADGTSSFFVADFTEVDNNVTRHVPEELKNNDWNTMVLHYLGLDHIGHKTGPRGPNMIPKQREMDAIVEQIYNAMESNSFLEDALLVLCGDHGMNDAGNHGGSAPGETSPALVFISSKFKTITSGRESPAHFKEDFQYYSSVEQSDIAPSLAALLGFPVPRNNLGAFITDFLPFWTSRNDKIQILLRNARQILNIVTATFSASLFEDNGRSVDCSSLTTDIERLGCEWVAISRQLEEFEHNPEANDDGLLLSIAKWSRDAQEIMSSTASNYDMTKLIIGQAVATIATVLALVSAMPTLINSFVSIAPFLLITLTYGVMMFASSYVEEEHHFWYWAASGWLVVLSLKGSSTYYRKSKLLALGAFGVLAALRILRRWNQTGQKLAGEPDIARTFFSEHNELLWVLIVLTYLWITVSLATSGFPGLPRSIAATFAIVLSILAVSFKLAFTNEDAPEQIGGLARTALALIPTGSLIKKARLVFWGILLAAAYTVSYELFSQRHTPRLRGRSLRTLHSLLSLFLATQSRATNIPALFLSTFQLTLLRPLNLNTTEVTTTILLFQYTSFFSMGGSNAISSVDLSSAYNGVSGYNVLAVGLLTFVGNWAGPIFWSSGANELLLQIRVIREGNDGARSVLQQHLALLTLFTSTSLIFVMAACTLLRTHLFIWTVFSPKYLFSMAWALGQHLLVNVGCGSVLYWLASR